MKSLVLRKGLVIMTAAALTSLLAADAGDTGKHLFILSGQSNMARLDPDISFTPAVEAVFGKENVIVVKDALGGKPIRLWYKQWKPAQGDEPKATGELYDRLMEKVNAAIDGNEIATVTFVWMQGERDAREGHGAVYAASLKGLLGQLEHDLGRTDVNFVIGRLSDRDMSNTTFPHWTMIRDAQVEFAEAYPRGAWVDTDDLNDGLNEKGEVVTNDLHYTIEGYKLLGKRFGDKAIALIERNAQANTAPEEPMPDTLLVYKTIGETELNLHVFNPEGLKPSDRRPAIVFFFGGGWKGGTPSQFYPHCAHLAERGMVAMAADYRVESRNHTTPKECVKDGKSAVRWMRQHAQELGIDPDRIAAGGGSAGGQVAAAAGTTTGLEEEGEDMNVSSRPNALVLFNPAFDNGPDGLAYDRVKDYWQEFSPLHNISESAPPTIVFLGTEDKLIPVATAEDYKRRMEQKGCRCDLHLYEGQGHGFFNFNRSREYYDTTVAEMDRFLESLGYLESK